MGIKSIRYARESSNDDWLLCLKQARQNRCKKKNNARPDKQKTQPAINLPIDIAIGRFFFSVTPWRW
jgi:hypothetical protein